MEDWEKELLKIKLQRQLGGMQQVTSRGLSPAGAGALLSQQAEESEYQKATEDIKRQLAAQKAQMEQEESEMPQTSGMGLGDIGSIISAGKKALPMLGKAGGMLGKAGAGLFTPWGIGALGLGYLFKSKFKPIKKVGKFFKRLF